MDMQTIETACEHYGAQAVFHAAHRSMNGDRKALSQVGLREAISLADAYRVSRAAYRIMKLSGLPTVPLARSRA
jgi:hypothetical protein